MGTAGETIQARIAACEAYDAIVYGQRAMDEMRGWRGCTEEYAAPGWAIAQFEAGIIAAAEAIGKDDIDASDMTDGAAWLFKRAKKVALEAKREADAAVKAIGTRNQLRIAIALAA